MSFKVIKPGFYSSVQDAGRFGFARAGLAKSGVMDKHAYCWANYLLDNAQTDAVLEITFGDCLMEAQAPTQIAVTGADMQLQINGDLKENWRSYQIRAGDILRWGTSITGMRAYLAVKGGFQTPIWFNARSVNKREHIGAVLSAGDSLPFVENEVDMTVRSVPAGYRPDYQQPLVLHMLPSYQFDHFTPEQVKAFFKTTYQISPDSDRTGYRLQGEPISDVPTKMTSEGMVVGSVEITSKGLPIILLNDAPTIGGYPKIGTVVSEDLAELVQRQPNTEVRFTLTTIEETQHRKQQWLNFFSTSMAPRATQS